MKKDENVHSMKRHILNTTGIRVIIYTRGSQTFWPPQPLILLKGGNHGAPVHVRSDRPLFYPQCSTLIILTTEPLQLPLVFSIKWYGLHKTRVFFVWNVLEWNLRASVWQVWSFCMCLNHQVPVKNKFMYLPTEPICSVHDQARTELHYCIHPSKTPCLSILYFGSENVGIENSLSCHFGSITNISKWTSLICW